MQQIAYSKIIPRQRCYIVIQALEHECIMELGVIVSAIGVNEQS